MDTTMANVWLHFFACVNLKLETGKRVSLNHCCQSISSHLFRSRGAGAGRTTKSAWVYFMWKGPSKEYCCERVPKKWCCESALRHGAVKAPEKCCCESAKNGAEKAPMVLWKRQKWCCESAKACAMKAQMVLWKRCRCCISTQKGCCESAAGAAEGPPAEP